MAKGVKTGGRVKGTPNKTTSNVREAIEAVYNKLGGDNAFANWAFDNQTEYYKIYSKLLPRDINATLEGGVSVKLVNEFE